MENLVLVYASFHTLLTRRSRYAVQQYGDSSFSSGAGLTIFLLWFIRYAVTLIKIQYVMLYFHFTFNICFLNSGHIPPKSINKSLKFSKYNIPFYKEGLKNDLTIQHLLITDRAFCCCTLLLYRILIANSGSYLFQIILVVYRYCGEPPITKLFGNKTNIVAWRKLLRIQ